MGLISMSLYSAIGSDILYIGQMCARTEYIM